jgi:hypothetical protein
MTVAGTDERRIHLEADPAAETASTDGVGHGYLPVADSALIVIRYPSGSLSENSMVPVLGFT